MHQEYMSKVITNTPSNGPEIRERRWIGVMAIRWRSRWSRW